LNNTVDLEAKRMYATNKTNEIKEEKAKSFAQGDKNDSKEVKNGTKNETNATINET
jgi:hypothetical protein